MSGPDLLARLLASGDLRDKEVRELVDVLVDPATADALRAGLLVALHAKGETPSEVAAFALELRRRALPVPPLGDGSAVDLCGSGGAPVPSFNVSTASAFVVAATGLPVLKHGNRSARHPTGSSDLLEALGLGAALRSRAFAPASFAAAGLAFFHAPLYHPATAAVAPVRRALGVPTVFNLLGPLTNPAHVPYQVVGAASASAARLFAHALSRLGARGGIAAWSPEGCDEFSPHRPSTFWRLTPDGALLRGRVDPSRLLSADERRGDWSMLAPLEAARATEALLAGRHDSRRGSVLLTSAAALRVSGRAASWAEGVELARAALDEGRAANRLERLRSLAESRDWAGEAN